MTRTPWIGHSTWRRSLASIGLALVLRPKKVTSTPLVRYWSTSIATCWPFRSASASRIGASHLLFAHRRSDQAGDTAEQICGLVRIEIARGAQHCDGKRANGAFSNGFDRIANMGLRAKQQRMHQKPTTVLPNSFRRSMRRFGPG